MISRERTLMVLGPSGAGKATIIGCMLFKYGGIDLLTMQNFQEEGVRTYDQASKKLKSLHLRPNFDTPKHHVTISDTHAVQADCTILVVASGASLDADPYEELSDALSQKQLIVVVNKMDASGWSEERFRQVVKDIATYLEKSGADVAKIPIIPVSALHGEHPYNIHGFTANCPE